MPIMKVWFIKEIQNEIQIDKNIQWMQNKKQDPNFLKN